MRDKRYLIAYAYIMAGVILFVLGCAEIVDEFWSGMGSALLVIGILRLVRHYRINKNEAYREKIEIAEKDERNHFLRNKAWAWAGYLFVMIMAIATIVLKIVGQETLMMAASGSVCLMLMLFWGSYIFLKRKY